MNKLHTVHLDDMTKVFYTEHMREKRVLFLEEVQHFDFSPGIGARSVYSVIHLSEDHIAYIYVIEDLIESCPPIHGRVLANTVRELFNECRTLEEFFSEVSEIALEYFHTLYEGEEDFLFVSNCFTRLDEVTTTRDEVTKEVVLL
ncbi:hypothetical protein MKZ01_06925 [Lysinibacillus endophyticus]|uniref:hypothetical protein n=1 Tax=Ureibacillus endophyticus TaxID=1978490 RepID=UPI0031372F82